MILKTISRMLVYVAAFFLAAWLLGPRVVVVLLPALVLGGLLWNVKAGYLRPALPGVNWIDYLAFVILLSTIVFIFAYLRQGIGVLLIFSATAIWAFFCAFRYPIVSKGATRSLADIFLKRWDP